jgi:hypothetical protein
MRERIGFSRAGAGDDQKRPRLYPFFGQRLAVGGCFTLRAVELFEV